MPSLAACGLLMAIHRLTTPQAHASIRQHTHTQHTHTQHTHAQQRIHMQQRTLIRHPHSRAPIIAGAAAGAAAGLGGAVIYNEWTQNNETIELRENYPDDRSSGRYVRDDGDYWSGDDDNRDNDDNRGYVDNNDMTYPGDDVATTTQYAGYQAPEAPRMEKSDDNDDCCGGCVYYVTIVKFFIYEWRGKDMA
ncbi:hypothetical protein ASPACDRAFT_60882 [Aspergillus aculeatus ATCC 16872]|uniref:Uncharacterized protein n=1 Tax=Aspergillus aculeatus (strain ATCC 16872 / CBS 172.66 / WB 5094) TaxID=690307 RepID=A0A1L9WS50_ASPA1|nr:uncharacterized protein ASPACDRAFT_60882 [Aspergillus aculeatus ATCC 16872]OJJ99063.1 hypothetical protein ASPACDRAFT_60882 [Aspergillus aculeatus ATCC 16872]